MIDNAVPTLVITDGEPDDMLAIGYMLKKNIPIVNITILNHQSRDDGWHRKNQMQTYLASTCHDQKFIVRSFDEIDFVSFGLYKEIESYDKIQIVCLANWYPMLELCNQHRYPVRHANIDVFAYGSANIRWAKRTTQYEYKKISAILNDPKSPYRFFIFETFGAFGPRVQALVTRTNMPDVYESLCPTSTTTLSSPQKKCLVNSILAWNNVTILRLLRKRNDFEHHQLNKVVSKCEQFREMLSTWNFSQDLIDIELLLNEVNPIVKLFKVDPMIETIIENPYEFVCADIGLVICAMDEHLAKDFVPCKKIEFCEMSGFATPKVASKDDQEHPVKIYYYQSRDKQETNARVSSLLLDFITHAL